MRIRRTTPARVDCAPPRPCPAAPAQPTRPVVDQRRVAGDPARPRGRFPATPGSSPKSQSRSPLRSNAGSAAAKDSCAASPSCARSAARSRPDSSSAPAASTTTRRSPPGAPATRSASQKLRGRRVAEALPQEVAQRLGQRDGRRPSRASRKAVTTSGSGTIRLRSALGSALQACGHLLADHARHEPGEPRLVELVEQRQRHGQRQPVQRMSGRKAVVQRQRRRPPSPASPETAPR